MILEADSMQAYTPQLDTLVKEESAAEEFDFLDFDRLWSEMHQGFPDGELLAYKLYKYISIRWTFFQILTDA